MHEALGTGKLRWLWEEKSPEPHTYLLHGFQVPTGPGLTGLHRQAEQSACWLLSLVKDVRFDCSVTHSQQHKETASHKSTLRPPQKETPYIIPVDQPLGNLRPWERPLSPYRILIKSGKATIHPD